MNHENSRELLALHLYGELSADEVRALERHLASCAECAAFAGELEQGLGVLARGTDARASELPPDWSERLRAATRPSRRWPRPLATFVAGVAAGLLVMAALRSGVDPAVERDLAQTLHVHASNEAPFVPRSEPPPLASSRGELARLDTLVLR